MSTDVETYDAVQTYVHLGPNGTAVPLPVTNTFWEEIASGAFSSPGPGRLVSTYDFMADWTTWERHPAGEELVVLLSGSMDLILSLNDKEEVVTLTSPGQFLIVPRNTWHTANVAKMARALFITEGEGTENRSRS
jgi:mannose-6-phosphate isomerase-like protein (cupin superfamily)